MAIIRKYIDKVFSQKYSLLDHKMIETYFTDEKLNQETKSVVRDQWKRFNPEPENAPNLDSAFYKLYYTIHKDRKDVVTKGSHLFLKLSRIAAVLVIGVLSAISLYLYNRGFVPINDQQTEFVTHGGFRSQFKLPDGTTGWLGYDSKLNYHVSADHCRIVDLDGLAFFDVMHIEKRPFIVKTTSELNIKVLGTRFNISSYSKDNSCEIVLERGSVKLNLPNQKVRNMVPGERVVYHSSCNSIERTKVDVDDFMAWKKGELILKDVSMKEACVKLSRFYNVEFELKAQGLDSQKIRMILKDDPLEEALKLLTIISPITYHIERRKVLPDGKYSKKKIIIKNKKPMHKK